jgi:hypothetical protein
MLGVLEAHTHTRFLVRVEYHKRERETGSSREVFMYILYRGVMEKDIKEKKVEIF